MSEPAPTDAGFTLVETIIAMVVAAIVAGVIGTAINVITRSDQPTRERLSKANEALTLTDVFPADIASTPRSGRLAGPAPTGCPGAAADAGANVLRLTSADPSSGITYRVSYRFDDAADTLVRVSCQSPASALAGTAVRTLATDVAAVTLETANLASAPAVTLVVQSAAAPPTVTRVAGVRVQRGTALLPAAPEPPALPDSELIVRTEATALHYDTAGEEVHFVVALTNTGSTPLDEIDVSDPALERWATSCPSRLEPGATATCEFINDVIPADIEQGGVQSATTVTTEGPSGTVTAVAPLVTVPAVQTPNLQLALQSSSTGYVLASQPVPFEAIVTNTGNVTLNAVSVRDDDRDLTICAVPALAPLATTTCSHVVQAGPGDATPGGTITALVSATASTSGGADVAASSNSVAVPYRGTIPPATPVPRIAVSVTTAPPGAFTAPTRITYQMTVSNIGDVPLTGVHVSEQSLSGAGPADCAVTELPLGASTTCTSEYDTGNADTRGAVTNVVEVTGTGTSGLPATATSASVTVSSLVPCEVSLIGAALDSDRVLAVTVETFGHCDALRVRVRPTGVPSGVVAPLAVPPEGSGSTHTATVSSASPWPTGPATIDVLPATSMTPLASLQHEVT